MGYTATKREVAMLQSQIDELKGRVEHLESLECFLSRGGHL